MERCKPHKSTASQVLYRPLPRICLQRRSSENPSPGCMLSPWNQNYTWNLRRKQFHWRINLKVSRLVEKTLFICSIFSRNAGLFGLTYTTDFLETEQSVFQLTLKYRFFYFNRKSQITRKNVNISILIPSMASKSVDDWFAISICILSWIKLEKIFISVNIFFSRIYNIQIFSITAQLIENMCKI